MSVATFKEKRDTVNKWIIDYAVFVVWNDYVEHGSVDYNCNRELIQWIISQESDLVPQTYILYLLCRLNDGENYMNKYSNDSTLTVLEDAADILKIFLTEIKQTFRKEGENLLKAIREEAVYVCCRDNNFDEAREVYERQFPSNSEKAEGKENINRDIQKLLKSKNPKQCSAENLHKYEDFLLKAKHFLKHFVDSEEPYLLQMTENNPTPTCKTRRTTDPSYGDYSDKRVNLASFMKVCEEMGVSKKRSWPNFMEQRSLKEHLQKVNAEKQGKSNSNVNANAASSPEKISSPKKRKLGQDEESAADKSLCTRVQDKANLNPHQILNFEIPKMATRSDKSPTTRIPQSPIKLRNPWAEAEVDEFYCAVQVYGIGNWSRIRDEMKTQRSNVQLKDKWRTILKCGEIKRLKKKFGDVKK